MDAFKGHDIFFITYESSRTIDIPYRKYLMQNIGVSPIKLLFSIPRILKILHNEKPDLIVSTGSEIAIPTIYLGKVLGIKSIFIESWCRVQVPSGTGKIVYPIADLFLVQWEGLLDIYGNKSKFEGGVF
jgi:UDP-N-acetylglucosamine:LPS N-acetylglucosamine transferase